MSQFISRNKLFNKKLKLVIGSVRICLYHISLLGNCAKDNCFFDELERNYNAPLAVSNRKTTK